MLKLYFCRLPEEERTIPQGILSAYREEKLSGQKNKRARLQSLCGELLLRYALQDSGFCFDGALDITEGKFGKPFLDNAASFFSLSHSADAILCALSDREIGADIQIKTKAKDALLRRCFTEDERVIVSNSPDPDEAFTEIWTKKESFCKRDGRGLTLPLGSFSVFDDTIAPLMWHGTEGEYHLACCSDSAAAEEPVLIKVDTSVLFP